MRISLATGSDLALLTLDEVFDMSIDDLKAIGKNARKSVEKFRWNKIIDKIEGVIN